MRSMDSKTGGVALVSLLVVALAGATALAQETAPAAAEEKLADQWDSFIHYVLMAREDLAESFGKALLAGKPEPRLVYQLAAKTKRSGETLARGRRIAKLTPIIDQIMKLIDQGAMAVRTDPKETARWIKSLGGSAQQYDRGAKGLTYSGEYAVPQLVATLLNPETSEVLRERILTVLPRLGRSAVRPLVAALVVENPVVREDIARALGQIGYPHAAAALKELAETKGVLDRTRGAALGAVAACAGKPALQKPVAELYYDLALKYYDRHESVQPDSRYDNANVWYWHEGLGVDYKVVPKAIFNEVYAMRASAKALAHDPKYSEAVSLWIAANYRKEANLPAGTKDPTRGADQPGADFYGLASGTKYQQAVLSRALADGDEAVAIRAIQALARTAGAANLIKPVAGGAQPLVAALTNPARLVRYLAADALAKSLPQKPFAGDHLVIGVLVEALRGTGAPVVVLADPNLARRNKVKDLVRAAGAKVFDADSLGKALADARAAGGADMILLASDVKGPGLSQSLDLIRQDDSISRAPVVIVAPLGQVAGVQELAKADELVSILGAEKLDAANVAAAMKAAGGKALSEAQAVQWAITAAGCLEDLALTRNPVLDVSGALKSLIGALGDKRAPVRVAAANALAVMDSADAQQAVTNLANGAAVDESVRLAAYAAAAKSVRRFGNRLTEQQVKALIDVVNAKGSLKIRDGAAQLLGALNLPSNLVKELIPQS